MSQIQMLRRLGRKSRSMGKEAQLRDVGEAIGSLGSLALLAPIAAGAAGGYWYNAVTEPDPEEMANLRTSEKLALLNILTERSQQRREEMLQQQNQREDLPRT